MKANWLAATAVTLALTLSAATPALADHNGSPMWNAVGLEAVPAAANLHASEIGVSAHAAAAIDVHTGRILYEKNGDKRMLIASITKIISTIVAIESGVDLESMVTVSSRAAGKEGSSIYLKVGEKQKLIDLLYAVMLRSGNDAATAVAEHVGGGSEKKFVELMNAKVEELGLTGTHFANPHGLDADGHYSTAHDMAVLSAYALRNETFREIVSTKVKSIPMPGESWNRKMYNKNKMLTLYPGADGVKTGYTKAAGRTLVSSATKDGRQVAIVTLDASDDWDDHARLLDFGFHNYQSIAITNKREVIRHVAVHDGVQKEVGVGVEYDYAYPVRGDEKEKLTEKLELEESLEAPIVAGQKVGEMKIYFDEKLVAQLPVLATHDVPENTIWLKLKNLFSGLIKH